MTSINVSIPAARRVLLWHPDKDESRVEAGVAPAAAFLGVATSIILTAIDSGDLVGGWFVDWANPAAK